MRFHLPHLPYSHADLEPFMSSEQVDTHYFGHHKAYVDKVNKAVGELNLGEASLEFIIQNYDGRIFDNGSQAWNHTFFWLGLAPHASGPQVDGNFMKAIEKKFGGIEGLRDQFIESALNLFGSGWTWLVRTADGQLDILNTQNADNPMRGERARPIWTCDVWEHAYYVDYRNERKEYLTGAWKHVNWNFVEQNFMAEGVPNMSRHMTEAAAAQVVGRP